MKKVVVLNEFEAPVSCCNKFRRNDYKEMLSEKKLFEKKLDESLNKLSSEGFELNTGKVYAHDVYVGYKVVMTGEHGVYSFSDTGKKVQYATYMGPVVEVEPISHGCKLDMPGCGGTGCNFKGIACRSKGGNIQYVNFTDNQHNIPEVQKLNEYFNLRQLYVPGFHDNVFEQSEGCILDIIEDDLLRSYKDQVLAALRSDIADLRKKGLGMDEIVEVPAGRFSSALVYSNESKVNVNTDLLMNVKSAEEKSILINKFDLWYFNKVKGVLRMILELILRIITLGLWKPREDEADATSIIEDQNIEQLEQVYAKQLNEQENINIDDVKEFNEFVRKYHLGKIPVTLAVHDTSWGILNPLVELIRGKRHVFYTCNVEMFKEDE